MPAVVAALGCGEGFPPARDPREPLGVVLDLGPELGQAALRPPDCEHLRVAEDVRRVLALADTAELERLLGKTLGVGKAAVERRPQGPEADRVPAIERLLQPFGELCHRLALGVHAAPVAELEEAVESRVVGEELDLRIDRLLRDAEHLLAVREALERHPGRRERPVTRVEGRDERFGVTEAPRHLDRLLTHVDPALDRLVPRPHLEGEVGEEVGAERAVLGREGGERFLQEPDAGSADLESGVEKEAAEGGHVSQRRLREQLAVPEPAATFDRLLEGRTRLGPVAGAPLRVGETQQELGSLFAGCVCDEREELERVSIVGCGILVGEHGRRVVSGPNQVLERLAGVPERRREMQVPGDLREMRIEVVAVHGSRACRPTSRWSSSLRAGGRSSYSVSRTSSCANE